MQNNVFFPKAGHSKGLPTDFLEYQAGLFSKPESDFLLAKLITEALWK
jgi:hypothetical protein